MVKSEKHNRNINCASLSLDILDFLETKTSLLMLDYVTETQTYDLSFILQKERHDDDAN